MVQELADRGRPAGSGKGRDPIRERVVERQLPVVGEREDGGRRERLRQRADREDGAGCRRDAVLEVREPEGARASVFPPRATAKVTPAVRPSVTAASAIAASRAADPARREAAEKERRGEGEPGGGASRSTGGAARSMAAAAAAAAPAAGRPDLSRHRHDRGTGMGPSEGGRRDERLGERRGASGHLARSRPAPGGPRARGPPPRPPPRRGSAPRPWSKETGEPGKARTTSGPRGGAPPDGRGAST